MKHAFKNDTDLAALDAEVTKLEKWLRDHPDAAWQERFDMIKRLAELNEQLNNLNNE